MTTRSTDVPSDAALRRCVGDVAAFIEGTWGRRPLLHSRADGDTYDDLLSIDHVDQILTATAPRRPAIRVVRDGVQVAASRYTRTGTLGSVTLGDLPDVDKLLGLLDGGATVVFQGLQRTWPPVGRFARQLELYLSHPVQANAYLTPPSSQGLRVHHDTHDVFALQTYGCKRWVTYPPQIEHPLPGQRPRVDAERLGQPEIDTELRPGDCLYLPRGTLHAAATTGEASLHLTIGVRAVTWHDVARRLLERTSAVPTFRQALPVGFAYQPRVLAAEVPDRLEQLADLIADTDPEHVVRHEADRFWATQPLRSDGRLRSLLELDRIDDDTVVAPRDTVPFTVTVDGERLIVRRGPTALAMPGWLGPAVRALLSGPVRLGDLPGGLNASSRGVLARRLIREGMVVAQPSSP